MPLDAGTDAGSVGADMVGTGGGLGAQRGTTTVTDADHADSPICAAPIARARTAYVVLYSAPRSTARVALEVVRIVLASELSGCALASTSYDAACAVLPSAAPEHHSTARLAAGAPLLRRFCAPDCGSCTVQRSVCGGCGGSGRVMKTEVVSESVSPIDDSAATRKLYCV